MNDCVVPSSLPSANAAKVGAGGEGGLGGERLACYFRRLESPEQFSSGSNWLSELRISQADLIGIEEEDPWVEQRQKLPGKRRLPCAVCSRDDDCFEHRRERRRASRRCQFTRALFRIRGGLGRCACRRLIVLEQKAKGTG